MDARPMGMHLGMPFEEYHAVDAVSASGLRVFARSPWHYKRRGNVKPTRPMLRGSLAHCALLEPDALGARYAVLPVDAPRRPTAAQYAAKNPSDSSRAAMAWWHEYEYITAGRDLITAQEFAVCQAQLAAIKAVPELASLLATGYGEVSIFWVDEATSLYCKARIDWLHVTPDNRPHVVELKSTADESPSAFGRTAARMKYEIQRSHYVAAVKSQWRWRDIDGFTFAAVTNSAPVLAVAYDLTDELIAQADDERDELLERLAWCMKEDQWPAYGSGKLLLDFPAYAKRSGEVEVSFVEE